MKKLLALALLVLGFLPHTSHATSSYYRTFTNRYALVSTPLNSCLVCHDTSPPQLSFNSYGNAFFDRIGAGDSAATALANIEGTDSDGDGFLNLAEITARTFPGDPNSKPTTSAPVIGVSPATLAFGTVTIGTTPTLTVTITNTGNAALSVTALTLSGAATFTLVSPPSLPATVGAGGSTTVTVRFSPIAVGANSGTLTIASNDSAHPTVAVSLTGTGAAPLTPVIGVSPATLAFGNTLLGSRPWLAVTITNTGNAALSVTSLGVTGSAEFGLTNAPALPLAVAAGGSAKVNVRYAPSNTGPDAGTLAIGSNDGAHPTVNVALTGTGVAPAITVAPSALAFGSLIQGQTTNLTVTLGNTGSADCHVTGLNKTGSADFSFGTGAPVPPFTITPGSTIIVPLSYTPANVGADSGAVAVVSDDPVNPSVSVTLSGTGNPVPPVINLTLTPAALAFGAVRVGQTATLTASIGNSGGATGTVSALGITGTDFAAAGPATPFTVAPGATIVVPVTYTPGSVGNGIGAVTVTSNDPNHPTLTASLTGNGVAPHIGVTPLAADFGALTIGGSATRTIAITNSGGATLTITALGLTGSAEFSQPLTAPFALAPGKGTNVVVQYAPVDVGTDAGTLAINSDDANVSVTLNGAGQEPAPVAPVPQVAVAPGVLSFGDVRVGATGSLTVTIQNNGGATAHLGVPGLAGSGEFSAPGAAAFDLAAGGSQTVTVQYAPTGVGNDTGTLTFTSDDPAHAVINVALTGRGVQSALAVTPATVNFGSVVTNGSLTRLVTIVNSGSASAQVTGLNLSGTAEFALGAAAPAVPFTVAAGANVDVPLTYRPVNTGADTGTLDVTSDDPTHPSLPVALSGSGVLPGGAVDLDITAFNVPFMYEVGHSRRPLQPIVKFVNRSRTRGLRSATVVGIQNDAEVYRVTLPAGLPTGSRKTSGQVTFPAYTPTAGGVIQWTATIQDDDPDADVVARQTYVKGPKVEEEDEDEDER